MTKVKNTTGRPESVRESLSALLTLVRMQLKEKIQMRMISRFLLG